MFGITQEEYTSEISSEHALIAGSKIQIAVPDDFQHATDFQGIYSPATSISVILLEMPFDYSEIKGVFSDQSQLDKQNMVLVNHQFISFNGQEAELLEVTQSTRGLDFGKHILVFPQEGSTIIVNGIIPIELIETHGDMVKDVVLSVVYDATLVVDPFETLPYTINVEETKLLYATTISGASIYSVDGSVPTESEDKTSLIVANSLGEVLISNREAFSAEAIRSLPGYSNLNIVSTEEVIINNIEGIETVLMAINEDGNEEQIFHTILFSNDKYYRIIGTTEDNFESNLTLFRTVIETFQVK